MVLRPANYSELNASLAAAHDRRESIYDFDLSAFDRLLEHKPEDMTASAESGLTLAELQKQLAVRGQWLPVDPPGAERLSLGALLATNASGPRRFGYGTIRDYVIGIKVALADGRLICSGGKVVKNVAGYDLAKLFIGSRGSLGVIVEANFKLRPLPETERFVQAQCGTLDEAGRLLDAVLDSELAPVALDLHQTSPAAHSVSLVIGFAGSVQEVTFQLERAATLGVSQSATLDYEREFWNGSATHQSPPKAVGAEKPTVPAASAVQKISVLPSRLIETLKGVPAPFVARAGNGVIYYRGAGAPKNGEAPGELCRRLKQAWDPDNILLPPPL